MLLSDLEIGECAILTEFSEDGIGRELRRMGFREGMEIMPVLKRGALLEYRIEESLIVFPENCSDTIKIEQKTNISPTIRN